MWIKDNWGRLVNSDTITLIDIKDDNEGKKDRQPSWIVKARTLKTDSNTGFIWIFLSEGHRDKEEAQMRMDAIVEAIKKGWNFLELE